MLAQVLLIASLPAIFRVGCATFLAYKERRQRIWFAGLSVPRRYRRDCHASDGTALAIGWSLMLVPVERIELPTFGLQNRCSTAELNRRIERISRNADEVPLIVRPVEYQTCPQRASS